MSRVAIVLFNLGGPDAISAIRPFLFNLFNDKAIIGAPQPIRSAIAWLISTRRAPVAAAIYNHLGGKSPLLDLTKAQGTAVEDCLQEIDPALTVKTFIAMRYWHPLTEETIDAVKAWNPDEVVLLPLYPQYSTTTTGSSVRLWRRQAVRRGLAKPTTTICCYPEAAGMIAAQAELLNQALAKAAGPVRVLFSAHGLPKSVIARGDPYQRQIEATAAAIAAASGRADLDWLVSYQSRVGPVEWIGPATDDEIRRAGAEGRSLVVQPIAFVSEHSETLVELDIEYGHLAKESGVPLYLRVPALGTHPLFIRELAELVLKSLKSGDIFAGSGEQTICPTPDRQCGRRSGICDSRRDGP